MMTIYDKNCDICKFNKMSNKERKEFEKYWKGKTGISDAMRMYKKAGK
jgi:hypothetical protein